MQPPASAEEKWRVVKILGGGATPFRVWVALRGLLRGGGVGQSLMREILPLTSPHHSEETVFSHVQRPQAKAASAAARQLNSMGTVERYCRTEAGLNESQLQAVLAAVASPTAAAQKQINLIQVLLC